MLVQFQKNSMINLGLILISWRIFLENFDIMSTHNLDDVDKAWKVDIRTIHTRKALETTKKAANNLPPKKVLKTAL